MNVAEYRKVQAHVSLEVEDAYLLADYLAELKGKGHVKLFTHVPHETYTSSWSVKMRNKKSGVQKGIQDYIIVLDDKIIFLELKRTKGGQLSVEQKEWQQEVDGKIAHSVVAKGYWEAKRMIDTFLSLENTE